MQSSLWSSAYGATASLASDSDWNSVLSSGVGGGHFGDDGEGGGGESNPRDPRNIRFEGPWLQQQLILSASIGIACFLLFSFIRRRSPALFAPRTKLKGFAPYAANIDDGAFSWIRPTLRTDEIKILHIVGLDAAILLNFFKMGFWTFVYLSIWSCVVLMPVNHHDHGSIDGVAPSEEPKMPDGNDGEKNAWFVRPDGSELPWTARLPSTTLYHFTHLLSTYLYTALILRSIYKGFHKFVRSRQLYALDLLQSIPARTVEVRNLPQHLQREKDLAEYFETMGFAVESTVVVREVGGLKDMLQRRANALFQLERTWCKWLNNPTTAENYDPDKVCEASMSRAQAMAEGGERLVLSAYAGRDEERSRLLGTSDDLIDPAAGIVAPNERERPTMRANFWNPFGRQMDAITFLEARFRVLDSAVQKLRSKSSPPSTVGFVTFVDAMSAQIVSQSVHYPLPAYCKTSLAPEPRDIIWNNVSIPSNERRLRQFLVGLFTLALFIFYIPPLTFLASLLSQSSIKKYLPALYKLLEKNERLMAFVSNSLPSVVLISFNALLPLVLEWTGYLQGLKARSLVEFSVLKRYHLFLLISVIFIFLITRTALGVITDLAGNPMRIVDKLAQSLPQARHFSLSYVVFQSLAVIPLQLLQLPVTFGRAFGRLTARTPREHAELNAPPQLYAGSVYPSALIVFTLCIVYSIVSPLITIFGAIYFALAYLVYKYKLLYVFYRSYESRGQAWPLSSMRCVWALILFQIFQLSLFSVRKQLLLSTLMLPLIGTTIWFAHLMSRMFHSLSDFVSLSSIAEINKPIIQPGSDQGSSQILPQPPAPPSAQVANSTAEHVKAKKIIVKMNGNSASATQPVNPIVALRTQALDDLDPSQTVLSRKRYAAKDDTLFVAQKDRRTDYREPPGGGYFYGTLNTGRRRYGHPALTAMLPDFWPPVRSEADTDRDDAEDGRDDAVAEAANQAGSSHEAGSALSRAESKRKQRAKDKARESVVVSIRRRKSSLVAGSQPPPTRGSNARHLRASSVQVGHQYVPSTANTEPTSIDQTRLDDPDCQDPGHMHEDPSQVWNTTSGTTSSDVFLTSGRAKLSSTVEETSNVNDQQAQSNLQSVGDDEHDEEGEESADEIEGVYIHRPIRQTTMSE